LSHRAAETDLDSIFDEFLKIIHQSKEYLNLKIDWKKAIL